jgi:hypothetical protein
MLLCFILSEQNIERAGSREDFALGQPQDRRLNRMYLSQLHMGTQQFSFWGTELFKHLRYS